MAEPRTVRMKLEALCDSCDYTEKMEESVPDTLVGHPLFNLIGFTDVIHSSAEHTRVTGHKVFFHGFAAEAIVEAFELTKEPVLPEWKGISIKGEDV